MLISDLITNYLSFVKRQHSDGTFRFYKSHLNHFKKWITNKNLLYLDQLHDNIFDDYVYDLKKTCQNVTINKRIGALKRCFKQSNIDMPGLFTIQKFKERSKTFNMLSREQLRQINQYMDLLPEEINNNLMYKVLIKLLTETGSRINELMNVKKKNITFEENYGSILLTQTKTNEDRIVPFKETSISMIKKLINENKSPYLFYNKLKKRQMNYDDVRYIMRFLKAKLKIDVLHPHMFRHSMATIWLENGADLKSVMVVLGHKNIETTNRYLHSNDKHIKETYISKFNF